MSSELASLLSTPLPTATEPANGFADLAEFTIVPANEQQLVQQARAAFVPWSRGLSFEVG